MEEKERKDEKEGGGDWESRRLCPDESCIGVIGPDGRCKECGRAAEPVGPQDRPPEEEGTPAPAQQEATEEEGAEPPTEETEAPTGSVLDAGTGEDDWENRRLCPDESCIGVIGPDGRCKECGRRLGDVPDPESADPETP
jgi:hypothetical protein